MVTCKEAIRALITERWQELVLDSPCLKWIDYNGDGIIDILDASANETAPEEICCEYLEGYNLCVGVESWKSVSEPYWDGTWIKVDCVAQNCKVDKSYHARICCEGALPTDILGSKMLLPDEAVERSSTVKVGGIAIEMNCGSIPIAMDIVLTEGWVEKDRVTRIIEEKPIEAKGEITICNINGLSCPSNGKANPGDKISVTAEMKNIGTEKGKFMFYVLDQHGNELSKAGGIGYKDVKAGETWKVTPKSLDDLDFKMPTSAIIKGQLKLARLKE